MRMAMAFLFQEDFNPEFPPRLGTLTLGTVTTACEPGTASTTMAFGTMEER
jgi:hypothetical protein